MSFESLLKWLKRDVLYLRSAKADKSLKVNIQTGTSYTLEASDLGFMIIMTNAGANTVTVPIGLPEGFTCLVLQAGAGQTSLVDEDVTFRNGTTLVRYAPACIIQWAEDDYLITGTTSLTALSVPGSFAAGTPTSTTIPYSWAAVSNESSFVLEVATDSAFTTIVQTLTPAADATSATATGLIASTPYYARLRAIGDGVTYSNSANTTTVSATTAAAISEIAVTFDSTNGSSGIQTTRKLAQGQNGYLTMTFAATGTVIIGLKHATPAGPSGTMALATWLSGGLIHQINNGSTTSDFGVGANGDVVQIKKSNANGTTATFELWKNGSLFGTFVRNVDEDLYVDVHDTAGLGTVTNLKTYNFS